MAEAVRETTGGKMCAAAYECVGGEVTAMLQGALAPGGTLFIYGAMSGLTFQAGIVPQLFFDCKIHGFWVAP